MVLEVRHSVSLMTAAPTISLESHIADQIKAVYDLMTERDRRYEQRFAAQEKAVESTRVDVKDKFEKANEFRQTLSDQAKNFATAKELDLVQSSLESKLTILNNSVSSASVRSGSMREMAGWAMSVVIGLVAIATFFFKH
jgi:hypothetical protein